MLKLIKSMIEIIYIPGHAGIHYNEEADSLAGSSVAFGEMDMTAANVAASIRKKLQDSDKEDESTWSIERLKEKRGEEMEVRVFYGVTNATLQLKSIWVPCP